MKKESQWFSHDSSASADPKLIALTSQYGMTGYGRWWRLVELLRAEDQYKYCITTKFAYSVLSKELMCNVDEAKQFINDCIEEYQLLQTDGAHIWSDSLLHRMQHLDKKRESFSERGKKGMEAKLAKKQSLAEAKLKLPQANNNTEQNKKPQNISSLGRGVGVGPGEKCNTDDDLEQLKEKLFTDHIHFVHPLLASGKLNEEQLSDWLTAFNRLLAFRGEQPKSEADYRRHFINWFKFRDPAKEDPKTFLLHNKSPVVIATNSFLKTPEQVEKEMQMRNG